jgi:hypothetical protein
VRCVRINTDTKEKTPDVDCGVSEEMFPCLGKCCRKNSALFMALYEKTCPYCEISASLPYGENLKMVTILECSRFGYGKRLTE